MVEASHTSSLVQGRAWKLIIPMDPHSGHAELRDAASRARTQARERKSLPWWRKADDPLPQTFDTVLSQLSFICSKAVTA